MAINCKRKDVCQRLQLFANVDGPVTVLCDDEVANGANTLFEQCKWMHVHLNVDRGPALDQVGCVGYRKG